MPILHYSVKNDDLHHDYGVVTWRKAVLFPLTTAVTRETTVPDDDDPDAPPRLAVAAPARYGQLYRRWRAWIAQLSRRGWHAVGDVPDTVDEAKASAAAKKAACNVVVLMNCPPFGVVRRDDSPRSTPCGRARVCPFCYGRRLVSTAYWSLAEAYFVPGESRTVVPDGPASALDLLLVVNDKVLPYSMMDPRDAAQKAASAAAAAIAHAHERRGWHVKGVGPRRTVKGAGEVTLVAPSPNPGTETAIVYRRATFLLVEPEAEVDDVMQPHVVERVPAADVTRKTISDLVARACAYPAGMLYGDPTLAAAVLNAAAKAKLRAWTTTGLLRAPDARKLIAANKD